MRLLLSIGSLLLALPILQFISPPPTPQPPPQRGQALGAVPVIPQPAPLTAAECKCSIDVTVKHQSNGEPISSVMLTATLASPTSPFGDPPAALAERVVLTETTDILGHAVFRNLAEGTYRIVAQREGFFGPISNGYFPTQATRTAVVGAAPNDLTAVLNALPSSGVNDAGEPSFLQNILRQPVQHVAIRMVQGGAISGRVRDANQRPMSGILGSENITGFKAAIQTGSDLKIHVAVSETPSPQSNNPPPQPSSIRTPQIPILRPLDNLPKPLTRIFLASPMDSNGIITVPDLPEARFFIPVISGLPADAYVSEMRQGSRNILDDGVIKIGKEEPSTMEIVFSRGGGTISGTIQDVQHMALTNVLVFLIPDPPWRGNILLHKTATSSTKGTFTFQGVAPGGYTVISWANLPPDAEQNDEFVSKYDALGTRVFVNAGTPVTNIQATQIPENR